MRKKFTKKLKQILCYAVIATMVFSLMPLTASQASAASFSTTGKVSGLKVASRSYDYIHLSWNKYSGATGYKIYRATSKNGDYELKKTTTSTSFKISSPFNKVYYFKVKAYKKSSSGSKYSKLSSAFSAKATLGTPSLSVTPDTDCIKLSWTGVPGANGYKLYRATSKNGKYKLLVKSKKHAFKNTTVTKGKFYYYKIIAYKKTDAKVVNGYYSPVHKGITKRPAPKDVKVTAVSDGLKVTFDGVSNTSGYAVYRSTSKSGTYSKLVTTSNKYYRDTSVTKDKKYYYKVKSYITLDSKKHYSSYSSSASGTYSMYNTSLIITPTATAVKLEWTPVEAATGYQIYRATSSSGSYSKLAEPKGVTFKNTSVTAGQVYYYKVRAVKGSTYGPFCEPVKGMTTPKPPTNIKGSSSSSGIKLTWTKSTNADGYEIHRATSATGTYSKIGSTTGSSYTDTKSLKKSSKYYYKIRSYFSLNGTKFYGDFSSLSASRDAVVKVAVAWYGCRESNGSHKKIIDVYNSNLAPGCGKMTYSAAWCATYVSAVGIKAKATDIIVRHSYCPTMLSKYKSMKRYSSSKSYTPSPGDIIFYDWNRNGVPDHVGMIVSCKGSTVTAIEGNKNDAVEYREFSKGYTYILSYGLPAYDDGSAITYTGASTSSVATDELAAVGISTSGEPMGYSEMGSEYDEAEEALSVGCGEDATEMEQMQVMIETMKTNADPTDLDNCNESEYYAAFLYRLCQDADIDACIVTTDNENGEKESIVEVTLDDQLYRINPAEEDCQPVEYTPPITDCEIPE